MSLRRDFVYGEPFKAKVPMKCHFRVVVFDKQVRVYVNDQLVREVAWLKPDEVFG